MSKANVPSTIAELRKALPKGFHCRQENQAVGFMIHIWNMSDVSCFDAEFYVDIPEDKKPNIAAAYAAVRAFQGRAKP